jgi:uncharacterized protein (DUF2336 family)
MSSLLASLRGRNRPLLIFAPDSGHPAYRRQHELLQGLDAELADRDMRVVEIIGERVSDRGALETENGAETGNDAARSRAGAATGAAALRQYLELPPNTFAVLLVGKDGGVKLRRGEPVPPEHLFQLIDAMPMRRREMRERGRGSA